jgi:hypothetical protein
MFLKKKLDKTTSFRYNRCFYNYQNNADYIKYNLVQQNAIVNSRMNEYSKNKSTYIYIQEINYSSYNQHTYLLILHAY